ncbi:hypothetical protein [Pantoea sp.]|uniref:hypothetical protein n=1 Tax=Pantoea sp. TaxID=69393 RepID=UPI00289F0B85|nr:hypothetical protein [Pantoea sp.]
MCVLSTHNEIYAFPVGFRAVQRIVGALYTIKQGSKPIIVARRAAKVHYLAGVLLTANMTAQNSLLPKISATADKINGNINQNP